MMQIGRSKKIVVLGMIGRTPVSGMVWLTMQYVVGLARLGFDVFYVEAHARTPSTFTESAEEDGSPRAAAFIDSVMRWFNLPQGRWAFHALHSDGRCYGMSGVQLAELYRTADLIINLHGGTQVLPDQVANGRLLFLETDPVEFAVYLAQNLQGMIDYMAPHTWFFTWGENYGRPDCRTPVSDRFHFKPTRQPVVMDLWQPFSHGAGELFTTIASWRQPRGEVKHEGEAYQWSKHHQFLKVLDLPAKTTQRFELALAACEDRDRALLESKGWKVRDASAVSSSLDEYRRYICHSRGEFTIAKDQRAAAGAGSAIERRPTSPPAAGDHPGHRFSNHLPTGEGLSASPRWTRSSTRSIASTPTIRAAARRAGLLAIASTTTSLPRMLGSRAVAAVTPPRVREIRKGPDPFPAELVLTPTSRWPTRLPAQTVRTRDIPLERAVRPFVLPPGYVPRAAIVMVTLDGLVFTRLCLESVLRVLPPAFEIVVVDNGSTDGTVPYLEALSNRDRRVRVEMNSRNLGFGAATNRGAQIARGEFLVLLNNDTIVPAGSLERLLVHLADSRVGLVGAVTNRAGNEAQIPVSYRTCGELVQFAAEYMGASHDEVFDIRTVTMFCAALRRGVWNQIGPLDGGSKSACSRTTITRCGCGRRDTGSCVPRTCSSTTSARHRSGAWRPPAITGRSSTRTERVGRRNGASSGSPTGGVESQSIRRSSSGSGRSSAMSCRLAPSCSWSARATASC